MTRRTWILVISALVLGVVLRAILEPLNLSVVETFAFWALLLGGLITIFQRWDKKSPPKKQNQDTSRRTKVSSRGRKSPSLPKKTKYAYVDEVASDLKETAKNYEDPLVEVFLRLGGLQMRRTTRSQDFLANAFLQLGRNEFAVDFVNVNSRTGKSRQIRKKWRDSIGALANRFELYLSDDSVIELIPLDKKTHLFLSAFWQVFHPGLNGESQVFQNPLESGLGHRLREVANYLVENRNEVGPEAAFDIEKVPTRIELEEFFGHLEPRFPEIRDKIERWRLVEPLGAGGFGQVFRAEHVDHGHLAAIKLMSPSGPDGKKIPHNSPQFRLFRERFLDEAVLSMKVSSPFVVSADDSGREPWPWIRYPLIEGKTLDEAFRRSENPRAMWWNLAHDLISGLSTIHHEGLLHKDVKPGNMLRASNRFVLLDFGIGEVVGYSELSGMGGIGGTYGFMAPELLLPRDPERKPGFEIDIFSAGMTLLAFFDKQPFEELRVAQLSTQAGEPDTLANFVNEPLPLSQAPEETRPLLAAMLDFNPVKRPKALSLLSYVADFVDLEEKIGLIQAHRQDRIANLEAVQSRGSDERQKRTLRGPFESWKPLEEEIYQILEQIRPEYFIATLNPDDESELVYVQAITDGEGSWHIEAMSDVFDSKAQTVEIKTNFMHLNWTPPTASDPNYSMDLSQPPLPEMVRVITDAFEFGYRIKPRDVHSIEVMVQGSGKY